MAKEKAQIVYAVLGFAILEYVVPTAVTAGLLTIIVRTYEGAHVGASPAAEMFLGWFAAVLFVVSTGHSEKHANQQDPWGVVFDLFETAFMILAFHSLGLVTDGAVVSVPLFLMWLALYLLVILIRRARQGAVDAAAAKRLAESGADRGIIGLTIGVMVGCAVGAASFNWLTKHWEHTPAAIVAVLWLALLVYVVLAFNREQALRRSMTLAPAQAAAPA